jgi:hypothetical protein
VDDDRRRVVDMACALLPDRARNDAAGAAINYRDRSGMPRPPDQMRGAASDFEVPRDMRPPEALRAYTRREPAPARRHRRVGRGRLRAARAERRPAPGFRAPVLIVLHIGANQSVLPSLLSAHGNNPAVHAKDGQTLQDGILYVAPPDQHMLVDDGRIRLSHGSKEHHTAPGHRSSVQVRGARPWARGDRRRADRVAGRRHGRTAGDQGLRRTGR